jgi:hypothetical protein
MPQTACDWLIGRGQSATSKTIASHGMTGPTSLYRKMKIPILSAMDVAFDQRSAFFWV